MDDSGPISFANFTQDTARITALRQDVPPSIDPEKKPETFNEILARFGGGGTPEQKARKAAEEFVAGALVKPILAKLREMNKAEEPFAPGPYEKQFGPIADAEIAKAMVKSKQFGIVNAVERQLLPGSKIAKSNDSRK